MRLVLRRAAKLDLIETRRWYEDQRPGLGDSFLVAIEATFLALQEHPKFHPRVNERVRRAVVSRFPYGIFYTIDGDLIRVIAVLHHARNPETWKSRAPSS